MAYQSLYRRYRSRNFAEIKGQPHVTSALRTAVAEGRHGHAYLFSGPRGTGKTSSARVLAKALNCPNVVDGEPCMECDSCLSIDQGTSFDLHELDAASNNKVDDIRDLIAKVQLGSPGRTKVYILDEVHMLSTGAENALLKTLEEPPDHVVFVLATTEPHKVVPTIRSRTQHFEFHLLPADELADHVAYVVDDSGLDVSPEAIEYALSQGGGSARDTLSALDLVAAAGGVPTGSNTGVDLVRAIGQSDAAATIRLIQEGLVNGLQPRIIGEQTLDVIRNTFLSVMGASLDHLSDTARAEIERLAADLKPATLTRSMELIGQALVEIRQAPDPRVPLEVAVLRLARREGSDTAALVQRIEALETMVASGHGTGTPAPDRAPAGQHPSPTPAPTTPTGRADADSANADPARTDPTKVDPAIAQVAPVKTDPAATQPAPAVAPAPATPAATQPATQSQRPAVETQAPPPARRATDESAPRRSAPAKRPPSPRAAPNQDRPAATSDPKPAERMPQARVAAPDAAPQPPAVSTPPTAEAPTPADVPSPGSASPSADLQADSLPAAEPTTPAGSAVEDTSTQAPAAQASASLNLTLASATEAVASRLEGVSQKARVRFKGGQVSRVDGSTIFFAVPNQMHCDRCQDVKGDIEAVLTEHFGSPITVEVVVDGEALGSTIMDPAKLDRSATRPKAETPDEIGPVSELDDADNVASTGVDRLTKAFPGSKVIEHQSPE